VLVFRACFDILGPDMARAQHAADPRIRAIADRIRAALVRKGWTQERLEIEARFGQGYLTRLLKGDQKRIQHKTIQRIEEAMGLPGGSLVAGLGAAIEARDVAGDRVPTLQELPGYADAEFAVARAEPKIPLEVFIMARKTRLPSPPSLVTAEFLRGFVKFLAEHLMGPTDVKESSLRGVDRQRDRADQGARLRVARRKGG
jgi:transcriptional regulator with XRE-family HTH domain